MSGGEQQILISRNGEQFGPYPKSVAMEYLASGQLLPTDMAWHEGRTDWIALETLLDEAEPPLPPPDADDLPPPDCISTSQPPGKIPDVDAAILERFDTQFDVLEKRIIGKMPREEIVREWTSRGWVQSEVELIHDYVEATRIPLLLDEIGADKCSTATNKGIVYGIVLFIALSFLGFLMFGGDEVNNEHSQSSERISGRSFRVIFCPGILFLVYGVLDALNDWLTGKTMHEDADLIREKYSILKN